MKKLAGGENRVRRLWGDGEMGGGWLAGWLGKTGEDWRGKKKVYIKKYASMTGRERKK